jgi:hypothetical protein
MAGRGTSISQRFDYWKKKGLTDSEAMQKAIKNESKMVAKSSSKVMEKKGLNWAQKLKMAVTKKLAKKYHSPAGRKHMKGK